MHHKTYLNAHARSTLRTVEVLGAGQGIESVTSFVGRLAWHHSVKPSVLIGTIIDPGKSSGFLREEIATSFNSLSVKTAAVLQRLSHHAGLSQEMLAPMSMVHLHEQLDHSAKGLIRKTKQWCPMCYGGDQKDISYDRLIWSLQGVTHCPIHLCPLRESCHHCFHGQPYLSTKAPLGFCHYCGKSLAETGLHRFRDGECQESREYSSLVWGSGDRSRLDPQHLQKVIQTYAYSDLFGSESKLADFLMVDRSCLRRWISGDVRPALESVKSMFLKLSVPWADLLMGRLDLDEAIRRTEASRFEERMNDFNRVSSRHSHSEPEAIIARDQLREEKKRKRERSRQYLEAILCGDAQPLSRVRIAAELEVSVGYLESSFGGEMKVISSMYEDVLYGERRNRIYELEAEVYVTLQRLADRGEELSWNKMCENLREDTVRRFSKKELAHVRREAMPEITSGAYKEAVEHQKKAQAERIRRLYDLGVI